MLSQPNFGPENNPRQTGGGSSPVSFPSSIEQWLEKSSEGEQLRKLAGKILQGYTPLNQIELKSASLSAIPDLLGPTSWAEVAMNWLGKSSSRQVVLRKQAEATEQEISTARATNQDLQSRLRFTISKAVKEMVRPSDSLKDVLAEAETHRHIYDQRREEWDALDWEVTRMAGGAAKIAIASEFDKLPEFLRTEIRSALERGRERWLENCLGHVRRIIDWEATPDKFEKLALHSKDGTLSISLALSPRDLLRAFRSVVSTGRYFLELEDREDVDKMEYHIKEDLLIGSLNQFKKSLDEIKEEISSIQGAVSEVIVESILRSR